MNKTDSIIEFHKAAMKSINAAESGPGKTMTVREAAFSLGCNPETIKGHIRELWPDLMVNGKTTYLTEAQATVILEKMKVSGASMAHIGDQQEAKASLQSNFAGTETGQSRVLRLQILQKQMQEIYEAEIAELKTENNRLAAAYGREVLDHKADKALLCERETGLEIIQRIAESGGLVISDRDDLTSAYRGGRA